MAPFKLIIDKDAISKDYELKFKYSSRNSLDQSVISKFNITVEDVLVDFDLMIDSYSYTTKKLGLGLVNIAENNAQAITIQIPEQENIKIIGANAKALGDLNSNEDTTVTFEGTPKTGLIKVLISYNDETNQRRTIEKILEFNEESYEHTKNNSNKFSVSTILLILTWLSIIIYIIYKKNNNKKLKARQALLRI